MWTLPTDKTWKYYGGKAPYYGVFGQDMYLNNNLNDHILNDFFSSGNTYIEDLFAILHNKIDSGFKAEKILDFGCGPGRFIIPFSRYANEIVGIDISQNMLDEASKNCLKHNVTNASFFLSDDNLSCIRNKEFDLVHSFIVLQHLNIKRGEKLIKLLLNSIKPNGIGVIHVTYYDNFNKRRIVNYLRNRIPYLADALKLIRSLLKGKKYAYLPQMQMNSYNLNYIFQLLQKEKITEVYSSFTNHYDYFGITLIFKKP